MTIQQIRYALEVKNRGSITKAAKALYTSQPNLSTSIKSLEDELGFPIFHRVSKGITITKEGERFFQHSRALLRELESIQNLKTESPVHRLHISGTTYRTIDQAFLLLIKHYQDSEHIDFRRNVSSFLGTIDEVYQGGSELGVLVLNQASVNDVIHLAANRGLQYTALRQLPLTVQLRFDHPLINEKPFCWEKLRDYPFIDYLSSVGDGLHGSSGLEQLGLVNPGKSIRIDNPANRVEIAKHTNAYFIGCPLYAGGQLTNELAIAPIPGIQFEIAYVFPKGSKLSEEARQFLRFFFQECGIDKGSTVGDF